MRTSFVLAGLTVIASVLFFSKVHASVKEGQKFDNWVVACSKDQKDQTVCVLTQQVLSKVENKKDSKPDNKKDSKKATAKEEPKYNVLAVYQIGYFGPEKKLGLLEILPANVSIQPGTSVISGQKLLAPGKYLTCNLGNCQALVYLSDADLDAMLANVDNAVGFMDATGKQVNLPISMKGAKEGLAALKE